MRKVIFYVFSVLGSVFVVFVFVLYAQWHPIVTVNGSRIWARHYFDQVNGFERYRRIANEELDGDAVRRGIVLALIIDSLIQGELLRKEITGKEMEMRVEEALRTQDREKLEKATQQLYGWTIRDLKKFSLEPQARQDILTSVLEKEGKEFNAWLQEEFQIATIKIYFLPYRWQAGELIER